MRKMVSKMKSTKRKLSSNNVSSIRWHKILEVATVFDLSPCLSVLGHRQVASSFLSVRKKEKNV